MPQNSQRRHVPFAEAVDLIITLPCKRTLSSRNRLRACASSPFWNTEPFTMIRSRMMSRFTCWRLRPHSDVLSIGVAFISTAIERVSQNRLAISRHLCSFIWYSLYRRGEMPTEMWLSPEQIPRVKRAHENDKHGVVCPSRKER